MRLEGKLLSITGSASPFTLPDLNEATITAGILNKP